MRLPFLPTRRLALHACLAGGAVLFLAGSAAADLFDAMSAYRRSDFAGARAACASETASANSGGCRYLVALMELRGEGGARDTGAAVRLLEPAAAEGYAPAQYLLGSLYLGGKGVAADPAKGRQLLKSASANDYRALLLVRNGNGRKRGQSAAARVTAAARRNDRMAQRTLALMYLTGNGVPRDPASEASWYRAAATGGDARSALALGLMYHQGQGVPRDDAEAIRLVEKAARGGDAAAMYYLGTFFHEGVGMPVDRSRAAQWILKGAQQGYPPAEHAYGMLLFSGDGVAVDRTRGVEWLARAAKHGNREANQVLRTLVALPGVTADGLPSLRREPSRSPEADERVRLEGKGVVVDQGDFSLKFSMPDVVDPTAPKNRPLPSGGELLRNQIEGGKFEIIFHTGK